MLSGHFSCVIFWALPMNTSIIVCVPASLCCILLSLLHFVHANLSVTIWLPCTHHTLRTSSIGKKRGGLALVLRDRLPISCLSLLFRADKSNVFPYEWLSRYWAYCIAWFSQNFEQSILQHWILHIPPTWNISHTLHCMTSPSIQVWCALSREESISMKPSLFVIFSKCLVRCRLRISCTLTTPRTNYCALNLKSRKYAKESYIKLEECQSPIRPYHLQRM